MYTLKSYAKLNLFLHIIGQDSKNYHLLQSIICFIDLHDEIRIEESDKFQLDFIYNNQIIFPQIDSANNTITRIIEKFPYPVNFKITVCKNIPIGAGLGGGSSNAATIIRFLQSYYKYKLSDEEVLSIGCDVPCFLSDQKLILVEGVGEIISEYGLSRELEESFILIIYPQIISSTIEAYKLFNKIFSQEIKMPLKIDTSFLLKQHNDLTNSAIQQYPQIKEILNFHKSIKMSGSGSTCFMIFNNEFDAQSFLRKIKSFFPNYFYHIARIIENKNFSLD